MRLERDGFSVAGFAGRPTLNRPDASLQYLFVNGRPVKDRLLLSAIRGAYQDFMPRGRYPLAALFLTVPVEAVDVNVHPAKAEVRFREASLVRSLLVSALHEALRRGASVPAGAIMARPALVAEARPASFQYRAPLSTPLQSFTAPRPRPRRWGASPSSRKPHWRMPRPRARTARRRAARRRARPASQDLHRFRNRGRHGARGPARRP